MKDIPEIVRELKGAEKLGRFHSKIQGAYEESELLEEPPEDAPDKCICFVEDDVKGRKTNEDNIDYGAVEDDKEIGVGENRIYLGEDNILYLIIFGEVDEEIQIGINEACLKLMNVVEGKANTSIDLNKAGKTSSEARKKLNEISEHKKK